MIYAQRGKLCRLQDISTGSCIMFAAHDSTRIGFVIELSPDERAIIDPNYVGEGKREYPVIYAASTFRNDDIFLFENARIVPDMRPEAVRFGMDGNGGISKSLYVIESELVIQAARSHHIYQFDLVSGPAPSSYGLSRLRTTRWWVEALDADGDYRELAEFSA